MGPPHNSDIIMGTMASLINSLTSVYSTVHSCADQRKQQSSASLAFVRGIHWRPVNSPHKWPVTRKMFLFDDVIMRRGQCTLPCILKSIQPTNEPTTHVQSHLDLSSLSGQTSYRKISPSLEAVRFGFKLFQ